MTKKDYKLIAKVIRDETSIPSEWDDTRLRLAEAFAKEFAEANPRFNREQFILACDSHGW